MLTKKLQLPITHYQLDEVQSDNRFVKVKVWVAHTGENLNGTVFSKESLIKMSKTLSYVPIVGLVGKNQYGEEDFRDHAQVITLMDDDIKVEYLTIPFGFIPNNPNSKIEYRNGKEFLTCEGYLWTRFDKVIDLFRESNGRKSQSMEVSINEFEYDEFDRIHITDGNFEALCILGDDVPPAMTGASVDMYTVKGYENQLKEMIQEFSLVEGGNTLDRNKEKEVLEQEQELEVENDEVVETETETVEDVTVETDTEQTVEEEATFADEHQPEEDANETVEELEEELKVEEEAVEEVETEAENDLENEDENLYKEQIVALNQKISTLESELEEYKAKVLSYEKAEKEAILDDYKEELSKEQFEKFEQSLNEFSKDQLEKEIVFAIYASKRAAKENDKQVRVYSYSALNNENSNDNEVSQKYGEEIGSLFIQ